MSKTYNLSPSNCGRDSDALHLHPPANFTKSEKTEIGTMTPELRSSSIGRHLSGQNIRKYTESSNKEYPLLSNMNHYNIETEQNPTQFGTNKGLNRHSKTVRYHRNYSNYSICNNCGKSGHLFHQCKMPIMSIGIIVFRVLPIRPDISDCLVKERNDNNLDESIQYLIIRRKETLGYIDFMRGKYSVQNKDYIMNMLKQMTNDEKEALKCGDFDKLWNNIWGISANNNQYKTEEFISREKYFSLIKGINLYNDSYNLNDLIELSNNYDLWEEPEWGFPKGRRNNQESDYDCALREFSEETGYSTDKLYFLQNISPYEEIFTGSNYKSYKHKYFLMYMNYEDSLELGEYQKSEVSSVEWKSYKDCIKCFRSYNLEKLRILKNINDLLTTTRICFSKNTL